MEKQSTTGRRVALVTGGSYGIGAAIAQALARDGFDVAVTATRIENVAKTRASLEAAGVRALDVALDLTSRDSMSAALTRITEGLGPIDVLVNNAGTNLQKPVLDITPEEWQKVMDTNVTGTFFLSQEFARRTIGAKRPALIVNVSSTHGLVGAVARAGYGISKGAIIHMTRMLAIEWASQGIRVNAIAPSRVESGSPGRAASAADPAYMAAKLNIVPLKRFCSVEDCAEAVRYLASPGASFITGHILVLDGGMTVW